MPDIRINITPILASNAQVDVSAFKRDATSMLRRVAAEGHRKIAKYPPQRLKKTNYRRTGTLKRSWSHRVGQEGQDVAAEVGSSSNIAPYNRYVQGPREGPRGRRQVKAFRQAGWQGVDELEKMQEDMVQDGLQEIIDRLVR